MSEMREFENIERCCQLHEAVEITYVVDGYVAALMTRDGSLVVLRAKADTMAGALMALDEKLKDETLVSVRVKDREAWRCVKKT